MNDFKDRKITVAGLGVHGGAAGNIRWLYEQGAELTVTDIKSATELQVTIDTLRDLPGITWVLGEHRERDFTTADMVLRNPALRRNNPYLLAARQAGVPIEMDSSLFFKYSPTKHIIGVTGSKGKTSTTHSIAALMNLTFAQVAVVGVEGTSPLAVLPQLTPESLVVFELSSWRLEAMAEYNLSPHTSVVTSIYHDHLNTYDSFSEYVETKKTIVRYQPTDGLAFYNYDNEDVRLWAADPQLQGRKAWYSMQHPIPGDGIFVQRNSVVVTTSGKGTNLFSLDVLPRRARHEQRNILPAIYLAFTHGVPVASIANQLAQLPRLPHRLELIATINKVRYINDSAATIPEATIAAVQSIERQPLVLILGGNDKKLTFETLAKTLTNADIRALIFLPGDASIQQQREILGAYKHPPQIYQAPTMEEAVATASACAESGFTILLSPGATSFGSFANEFDRGDQFRAAVSKLQ